MLAGSDRNKKKFYRGDAEDAEKAEEKSEPRVSRMNANREGVTKSRSEVEKTTRLSTRKSAFSGGSLGTRSKRGTS
jgi:hypothetical protein